MEGQVPKENLKMMRGRSSSINDGLTGTTPSLLSCPTATIAALSIFLLLSIGIGMIDDGELADEALPKLDRPWLDQRTAESITVGWDVPYSEHSMLFDVDIAPAGRPYERRVGCHNISEHRCVFTALKPDRAYIIRVRAVAPDTLDQGPWSKQAQFRTRKDGRSSSSNQKQSSSDASPIQRYQNRPSLSAPALLGRSHYKMVLQMKSIPSARYQVQRLQSGWVLSQWIDVEGQQDGDKFIVSELLPDTQYLFRYRWRSDENAGWSPWSEKTVPYSTEPLPAALAEKQQRLAMGTKREEGSRLKWHLRYSLWLLFWSSTVVVASLNTQYSQHVCSRAFGITRNMFYSYLWAMTTPFALLWALSLFVKPTTWWFVRIFLGYILWNAVLGLVTGICAVTLGSSDVVASKRSS